jgi:hypothetical protein
LVFLMVSVEVAAVATSIARAPAAFWSVVVFVPRIRVPEVESIVRALAAPETRLTALEPVARLLGFKFVRLAPEIAGSAPLSWLEARLVSPEPFPEIVPEPAFMAAPDVVRPPGRLTANPLRPMVMAVVVAAVPTVRVVVVVPASMFPAKRSFQIIEAVPRS